LDEEGNVIAGETVNIVERTETGDDYLGPLGKWILAGMRIDEVLDEGIDEDAARKRAEAAQAREDTEVQKKKSDKKASTSAVSVTSVPSVPSAPSISIHTIELPARAPKKLLLDIKRALETFPGKEKVQLKIGEQTISLPVTINMSTPLEAKLEEIVGHYK